MVKGYWTGCWGCCMAPFDPAPLFFYRLCTPHLDYLGRGLLAFRRDLSFLTTLIVAVHPGRFALLDWLIADTYAGKWSAQNIRDQPGSRER